MTHPYISSDERNRRRKFVEDLVRFGTVLEFCSTKVTMLTKKSTGKGVLCLVDDDPLTGSSVGPKAFPQLDIMRRDKTHCLIEGGIAPDYILAQIKTFVEHDYKVMWVSTQNTHEIEWTNWAQPHEAWAVMVVLTREEGSA